MKQNFNVKQLSPFSEEVLLSHWAIENQGTAANPLPISVSSEPSGTLKNLSHAAASFIHYYKRYGGRCCAFTTIDCFVMKRKDQE